MSATVAAPSVLTLADAARMIQRAVKDKTYQQTPLGTLVGRYIRWLRNEWGATPATVRDYEAVLARMSLTLGYVDPIDVSIDDLREVIDLWGERTPRTRQKITSVIRAFWGWMEEQGHIAISPAARIRRPRAERRVARLLPADARPRLLTAANILGPARPVLPARARRPQSRARWNPGPRFRRPARCGPRVR